MNKKPAFFVFDASIHDPEAMQPYHQQVEATYKAFGGKLLVLGKGETVEGVPPLGTLVILQFDSLEDARAWHASAAYQAIIHYRHAGANTNAWLVEGMAPNA